MLTISHSVASSMETLRIAGMLREQLAMGMPEMFVVGPDGVSQEELVQLVDEVRTKLHPWGMETERIVLKYCFGSLLLGAPVEQIEPRLVPAFASDHRRYRKEEVLDLVVERELARRDSEGAVR